MFLMKNKALQGIRIMEFGSFIAGPAAGMMLAGFGAEILKVEHPVRFDGGRYFALGFGSKQPNPKFGDQFFDVSNLDKKSVVVDYSKPAGKEILLSLAATCDVLLENMTPGTLERNGLGYEDLKKVKPDIIYISSSSCGQDGPEKNFRGYAGHFAAKCGLGHITGYPGSPPSMFVGSVDFRSASNSAIAILMSLLYRQKTGKGQFIDLASQEAIGAQLGDVYLDYIINGREPQRMGNRRLGYCPNNAYKILGNDEWISISCYDNEEFAALCKAMGKEELISDPRFVDFDDRKKHEDQLDAIIGEWTAGQQKSAVWKTLIKEGVPSAPYYNGKDVSEDRHNLMRGSFISIDHPQTDRDYIVNTPWRYATETPAEIKRHAPYLGEHTRQYLRELGKSDQEIDCLVQEKVVLA